MCLIAPIAPRKKASKKGASKPSASGSGSSSPPAARFINNATTCPSHTVEFPTSHLPTYLCQRSVTNSPTTQSPQVVTDTPSCHECLPPAVPTCTIPNSNKSVNSPYNSHYASVLPEIDFVQNLSRKFAPAPASPKGPSETEKAMQAEIKKLGDMMSKREREEEISVAVAKTKAEVNKERDAELQKSQKQSSFAGSCECCPENGGLTKANIQDRVVIHLCNHGSRTLDERDLMSRGLGYVDIFAGGLCERRRSSVGNLSMGAAKRVMDRMCGIEARTALLEREMNMGRERNIDHERRRYWERELERDRYLGSSWSRGHI
ncbi:hypothetical protein OIDMADRAFT_57171 [Oidiodendron maius Zn]|uniref:Uncharacterized protein n=1 Tax=Oidiodendron maius (strain Zn) TaxID=913774 RepID=A0A0C3D6Y4_OIDMZ|nr:hypothetical protein OIDMADRAFT_57171 [Oidiodendron maius Zn]